MKKKYLAPKIEQLTLQSSLQICTGSATTIPNVYIYGGGDPDMGR